MKLQKISISNFKNILSAEIEFSPKMNCLLGNNGMGKSNLLDAIHYLSFCKSFYAISDARLVSRGENFMMLKGDYLRNGIDEQLIAGYAVGRKKSFKRKGKEYRRLSDHIGLFPLVMVDPMDIDLINLGADERRRFMNQIISQSDHSYLAALIRYNDCLEQRNRMLRDRVVDHALYEAVEFPMEQAACYVADKRREWVRNFAPIFNRYYNAIAGKDAETVVMEYDSGIGEGLPSLCEQFDSVRRHDEMVGHTSVGVHRDDLSMTIDGMPLRRTASQGQCKTFVIAMRLAQYEFLGSATAVKPLLLLDDIFDKLDADRVERIVDIVSGDTFGQIFITDTNRDHLDSIMAHTGGSYRLWHVMNGTFSLIHSNQ